MQRVIKLSFSLFIAHCWWPLSQAIDHRLILSHMLAYTVMCNTCQLEMLYHLFIYIVKCYRDRELHVMLPWRPSHQQGVLYGPLLYWPQILVVFLVEHQTHTLDINGLYTSIWKKKHGIGAKVILTAFLQEIINAAVKTGLYMKFYHFVQKSIYPTQIKLITTLSRFLWKFPLLI